jgi:hypothetical protein
VFVNLKTRLSQVNGLQSITQPARSHTEINIQIVQSKDLYQKPVCTWSILLLALIFQSMMSLTVVLLSLKTASDREIWLAKDVPTSPG